MKVIKYKHRFINKERKNSDALFPSEFDGTVSFTIVIDEVKYGAFLEYKYENYYTTMKKLVRIKHRTIKGKQ